MDMDSVVAAVGHTVAGRSHSRPLPVSHHSVDIGRVVGRIDWEDSPLVAALGAAGAEM